MQIFALSFRPFSGATIVTYLQLCAFGTFEQKIMQVMFHNCFPKPRMPYSNYCWSTNTCTLFFYDKSLDKMKSIWNLPAKRYATAVVWSDANGFMLDRILKIYKNKLIWKAWAIILHEKSPIPSSTEPLNQWSTSFKVHWSEVYEHRKLQSVS